MSSTQWEVVTKSKKLKNLEKKLEAHTEKKRIADLGPKLEEILPSQQYRNLIAGAGGDSWDISPTKSTSSSTKSKSPKRNAKVKEQSAKKPQALPAKPPKTSTPKPKSLELALRNITPGDFNAQLEQLKLSYPGSELLWLKGVANYFNLQLPFDCDPTFAGKSSSYPSNLATPALKRDVLEFLELVGEENLAYFYHTLLNSMTTELSKNSNILGYKFLLQLIGRNWPQICSNNMAKTAILRNSYQNRSNICLNILWAVGQGGYQKMQEGVKVWQNLMLPNLELKSYSKFITDYIEKVLTASVDRSLNLNQNDFFLTYNTLKAKYAGIPRENQETLNNCAEIFLLNYIDCISKHANIFVTILRNIEDPQTNATELRGCIRCLTGGSTDSFKVWKMNYKKQLLPTLLLLKEIERKHIPALAGIADFHSFLSDAQKINEELELAKKRDPNLDELIAVVASVQEKSAQHKKRESADQKKKCGGCCKWFWGSILLIALIGGVLAYDTQVNGKGVFAKSATGKVLKNAGMLPYVEKAWYTTMSASARGYKWAEVNVPPVAKPIGKLSCDLYKLTRNAACNAFGVVRDFTNSKLPVAANALEQYVPGLPKTIETTWVTVKTTFINVFGKTVSFFKTQVLVGRLSPENLSKALNETQNVALEYYHLFHKKVDAYAKLK